MAGILSKNIKLGYSATEEGTFTNLTDLLAVPDLGGKVDKVETTTLADSTKTYIKGLKDYDDLGFEFLYDNSSATSSYRILKGLEETNALGYFAITFPDNTKFEFSAYVMITINSAGTGDVIKFVANFIPNSEIVVTDPTI